MACLEPGNRVDRLVGCSLWASRYTTSLGRTGVRAAEGAALEMPCTALSVPWVRIPPCPLFYGERSDGWPFQTADRAVAQFGSALHWG